MKKISLKNANNTLSRKEMKAISGGYAFGLHCSTPPYAIVETCCKYTFWISHHCFDR